MKFLAKMKEKQMQRKIGGMLCGLLCTGVVLVVPSAWADNYFGYPKLLVENRTSESSA